MLKNKRILIADDSQLNRTIVAHLLKQENALISEAEDGDEALKLLKKQSFDLVLLDINMPELTGEEIVNAKTEYSELNNNTPIIAFTGSYGKEYEDKFLKIGFSDVIPKPFTPVGILEKIKGVLKL